MTKETRENSSMTIRNLVTRSIRLVALSLRDIVGRLLSLEEKYGNAEFSAQIATGNIPSSNKATSQPKQSNPPSQNSQKSTGLIYRDANVFLHDIINKKIPLRAVTMEQWLIAILVASTDGPQSQLNLKIMHAGNVFSMHHCIEDITYPERAKSVAGEVH